ncbi:hypothetical protein AKJ39_02750 [candidate division MSBL1 archaeon SCGC-AAA259J03]|uniref:Uncharacterized protein n=1 Tax=candidate division MSBL1 archaeon SCGC-AAA259J03 TaxID=1698269 RepID=A0A656YY14_9EURY|nr:hypothetical protein AKJ39_02750 [candidate division MSBL1 archaeon SCGC-AAA259J03]
MKSYDKEVNSQDKGTEWWRVSFSQTFFERREEKGFTCLLAKKQVNILKGVTEGGLGKIYFSLCQIQL